MKKSILYIYVCLFSCISLTGCSDQCCDCESNQSSADRNFRLIRKWQLFEGIEKNIETEICFFHSDLAPVHKLVTTDTSYHKLPFGNYHILCMTSGDYYTGLDNYYTAQIVLPLSYRDSVLTTVEAPVMYCGSVVDKINGVSDSSEVLLVPAIKIINFRFIIRSPFSVLSCHAELSGVQTSAMLYVKQNSTTDALLPFEAKDRGNNIFGKSISILGLSCSTTQSLAVGITYADGKKQQTTVDLTDRFNFESSPIQNCTIVIDIDSAGVEEVTSITIEDWQAGTDDDIILLS